MIITHNGTILTNDGVVLNNIITSPSFTNTYSLDFDGMDDYVEIGTQSLGITEAISISAWVKIPISGVWAAPYVQGICVENGTSGINWNLTFRPPPFFNYFAFTVYHTNGTSTTLTSSGVTPNDGQWHHLLGVSDGTTNANGVKLYVDGVLNVQATAASTGTRNTPTVIPTIGSTSNNSWYFEGNIDEVSIFDTDQSSNIDTLSTAPTVDLTDLNPIAWYRMGDNGAYKDPQWLIPNNENKDKVSNYSMDFDGVNDKIDIGTSLNLGTDSTISMWIKRGRVSTSEIWLGESSYQAGYLVTITAANVLYFRIDTAYVGWDYPTVKSIFNSTTDWVNVVIVRSGDSIELFLNGISYGTGNSNFGTPGATVTRFQSIAAPSSSLFTLAQFDEVAAWNNNTVNPLDIYNGGTPTTLPSGAVAHWKMGEESTFLTNWTVPDAVGSNDGTSVNMTIEDRVGEAPGSVNNALSFNMDEINRVEDTPPT